MSCGVGLRLRSHVTVALAQAEAAAPIRPQAWEIPQATAVALRRQEKNALFSNMDTTRESHIKGNKSKRERQTPYDTTYM